MNAKKASRTKIFPESKNPETVTRHKPAGVVSDLRTVKNRDVFSEPTGKYSRRVLRAETTPAGFPPCGTKRDRLRWLSSVRLQKSPATAFRASPLKQATHYEIEILYQEN